MLKSLLLECINEWCDNSNLLKEFQAGFRKGYSTVDKICTLTSLVKKRLSGKRNKLYAFFVYSAAFDEQKGTFYKLTEAGVFTKKVTILEESYWDTEVGVWCWGGLSTSFRPTLALSRAVY